MRAETISAVARALYVPLRATCVATAAADQGSLTERSACKSTRHSHIHGSVRGPVASKCDGRA